MLQQQPEASLPPWDAFAQCLSSTGTARNAPASDGECVQIARNGPGYGGPGMMERRGLAGRRDNGTTWDTPRGATCARHGRPHLN